MKIHNIIGLAIITSSSLLFTNTNSTVVEGNVVSTDIIQVSAFAVSRDGIGPLYSVSVDLNSNNLDDFLAYSGFPVLPECFPIQTQYGPPACPAEFAEDYPSLRDTWVNVSVSDLNEPVYFGTPFTIMWIEVCDNKKIDPSSIWMFMIDIAGTHSTMFRTADHINVQAFYTDDQWFMHKNGKGFTVPIIIVGIQLIGLFEDFQVGYDYLPEIANELVR